MKVSKLTFNKLASLIANREGRLHQASIGDIREILKILTDLEAEYALFYSSSTTPLDCLEDIVMKKYKKLNKD